MHKNPPISKRFRVFHGGRDTEVRDASARIVRRVAGERAAQVASEAIAYIPPPPPEIIVWGERSRPLGTAPNFLRWAAGFLSGTGRAVEYVDRKIREEVPFAEFALEAISFAAGPASYAAGKIIMASPLGNQIERAAGRIASWAAGRLRGAGIDPAEAAYAASGAIFLGGLAFGARRALDLTRDIRYALGLGGKRSVVAERVVPEIGYTRGQLQHAFKHAKDFGIAGNPSNKTIGEFSTAIQNHIAAPGTQVIQGTYRGHTVTHFLDPITGLNVIQDSSGNFLSGWKLSLKQLEYVTTTGKVGGGR